MSETRPKSNNPPIRKLLFDTTKIPKGLQQQLDDVRFQRQLKNKNKNLSRQLSVIGICCIKQIILWLFEESLRLVNCLRQDDV